MKKDTELTAEQQKEIQNNRRTKFVEKFRLPDKDKDEYEIAKDIYKTQTNDDTYLKTYKKFLLDYYIEVNNRFPCLSLSLDARIKSESSLNFNLNKSKEKNEPPDLDDIFAMQTTIHSINFKKIKDNFNKGLFIPYYIKPILLEYIIEENKKTAFINNSLPSRTINKILDDFIASRDNHDPIFLLKSQKWLEDISILVSTYYNKEFLNDYEDCDCNNIRTVFKNQANGYKAIHSTSSVKKNQEELLLEHKIITKKNHDAAEVGTAKHSKKAGKSRNAELLLTLIKNNKLEELHSITPRYFSVMVESNKNNSYFIKDFTLKDNLTRYLASETANISKKDMNFINFFLETGSYAPQKSSKKVAKQIEEDKEL